MSISALHQEIEKQRSAFFAQINTTKLAWDDNVQEKYYNEFIAPFQQGVPNFLNELQTIGETIKKANAEINNL